MPLKITRTLPALKVNPGIRAAYRKELDALMRSMGKAVVAAILEEYDKIEWRVAQPVAEDAKWRSPAQIMLDIEQKLLKEWHRKFTNAGTMAAKLALKSIYRRVKLQRERALKELGISVKIDPSRFTNSVYQALFIENVQLIKTIPQMFFNSLETIVNRHISRGLDRAALAEDLYANFDPPSDKKWSEGRWYKHCRFIARDQTSKAVQALAESTDKDLGFTEGIWVHVPGRLSSRLTHIKMNGKQFKLDEGLYDPDVGHKVKPASEYNCLPGYAKLNGFSYIEKLYRRWFTGELTCLSTDNGAVFEVTPNHPILTPFGWKAANLLNVGDYVIQADLESSHVFKGNKDEGIPTIQEMFDAFHLTRKASSIFRGSLSQFHGDGSDGEVDIIAVDSLLMNEGDALFREAASEFGFTRSDCSSIFELLSGKSIFPSGLKTSFGSSNSSMGVFCERLSKFLCGLSKPQRCSLLAATYMYTRQQETSANSSSSTPEFFSDGFFCHAGLVKGYDFLVRNWQEHGWAASIVCNHPREFTYSLGNGIGTIPYFSGDILQVPPRGYLFGRITKKSVRNFSGHVYNLQTRSNSFISQNIVMHNCMCTYRPIIPNNWRA